MSIFSRDTNGQSFLPTTGSVVAPNPNVLLLGSHDGKIRLIDDRIQDRVKARWDVHEHGVKIMELNPGFVCLLYF